MYEERNDLVVKRQKILLAPLLTPQKVGPPHPLLGGGAPGGPHLQKAPARWSTQCGYDVNGTKLPKPCLQQETHKALGSTTAAGDPADPPLSPPHPAVLGRNKKPEYPRRGT